MAPTATAISSNNNNDNNNNKGNDEALKAAERKRKRLEAWRKRQKEGSSLKKVANTREKISVSLNKSASKKIKLKKPSNKGTGNNVTNINILGDDDEDSEDKGMIGKSSMEMADANLGTRWKPPTTSSASTSNSNKTKQSKSSPREKSSDNKKENDLLDEFMTTLESENNVIANDKEIMDTSNSVSKEAAASDEGQDLEKSHDSEDEEEQEARRSLIAVLTSSSSEVSTAAAPSNSDPPQLMADLKSQKQQREEHIKKLTIEAQKAKKRLQSTQDMGRMCYNDYDSGVVEEAERELELFTAAPDALDLLAELNKKKELKSVDHTKISYLSINKNLYIVPRALQNVPRDQLHKIRSSHSIKIRGLGVPVPLQHFHQSGLPERVLAILANQKIHKPFPIQAQCLPIIMMGRDCIGIAKTGSGKTLAYLLPMLRHILDQGARHIYKFFLHFFSYCLFSKFHTVDLQIGESGPIGLVLAPARELAVQIYSVCKVFTKHLNLKYVFIF